MRASQHLEREVVNLYFHAGAAIKPSVELPAISRSETDSSRSLTCGCRDTDKWLEWALVGEAKEQVNAFNSAALVKLVGFTTGAALYALLLWMVARRSPNKLLLATALLGLVWNVGGLAAYGARDFGFAPSLPLVLTLAYAALGFLPAVVVHLALPEQRARWLARTAYALSGVAALSHLHGAWTGAGPSLWALRALTARS